MIWGRRRWSDVPNLDVASSVVFGPDAEDVLTAPDTQHDTADLFAGVQELITHNGHEQPLPVAVCNSFLQAHDPLSTSLILFVLPHRPYSLFENIVVADCRQARRSLEVGEYLPELLGCAEFEYRLDRLLIVAALGRRWAEPYNPGTLERPGRLWIELSRLAHCVFGYRC
jgi:hypothetical protein